MRYLGLMIGLSLLSSCATVPSVKQLPPGSSVAVISGLDNVINFEYVGSTEYMNASFQYKAPQVYPNASFIPPIESSLRKSGYQVTVEHVPANSPLTNIGELSHPLNAQQFRYLYKILHGRQVDRVIILAKAPVDDLNFPKENIAGYGFLQREGTIYRGTQMYGAMTIRVVNMNNHQEFDTHLAYTGEQVDNNMFATSLLDVHPWAVTYFSKWVQTKFAPNMLASMRDMKLLRN